MRKIAFIFAILSLLFLSILINQKPIKVTSQENISLMLPNQKLLLQGYVTKQTQSMIYLNNNFSIICNNCASLQNKSITAIVILQEYNDKTQLMTLSTKIT